MIALAAIIFAASWFDVEPVAASPLCEVRLAKALKEIERLKAELAAIKAEKASPVITLVTTNNCTFCVSMESVLKQAGIAYQKRNETFPGNKYAGYPVLEMEGRTPLVGLRSRDDVELWMRGGK